MEGNEGTKPINVWQILGIIVVVFGWLVGMDNIADYCISTSSSWLFDIIGLIMLVLISYVAYKIVNKIIN